jgi:uncharacterized protein YjbI with pentapeptide repeats
MKVPLDEAMKLHKRWLDSKGSDGERLDWSGFDLRGIRSLVKEDLTMLLAERSVWFGQNLSEVNMQASQFAGSDMRNCLFESADLRGADFSRVNLANAKFARAHFEPLVLGDGRTINSSFRGANLRYADFAGADLHNVDFSGADLGFADFTGTNLAGATFNAAKTEEAKGL